jgi:hypothetical protein
MAMQTPSPLPAGVQGLSHPRDRRCVAAGRFEAPRVVIVLFGHPVPRVTENEGSIADVLGIVDRNRGCSAIAEHVR